MVRHEWCAGRATRTWHRDIGRATTGIGVGGDTHKRVGHQGGRRLTRDRPGMETTDDHTSARVLIEVYAGLIPGTPEPEHTRRWGITSDEWHKRAAKEQMELLAFRNGQAQGYAMLLMLQPDTVNWVRTDWVWL